MLIKDIVRRNAEDFGDMDALVVPGEGTRSWQTVEQRTNQLARAFTSLGLRNGDRCVIFAPNCAEYIEFFFACAKTGVIGAPVNIRLMADEISTYLRYVEPAAILVHASLASKVADFLDDVPSLEHRIGFGGAHSLPLDLEPLIHAEDESDPGYPVRGEDIYQLCPTSGTTGVVKGAMLTQDNAIASILGWMSEFSTFDGDTHLQSLSLFFNSGGPAAGMPPAFMKGGRMVLIPGFEATAVLRCIEEYGVYQTTMVPTMVRMLLDHPDRPQRDLSSLRCVVVGGSPVSAALVDEVHAAIGPVIYPWYAMAETYSSGLLLRPDQIPLTQGQVMLPTGRPQTNICVSVVDENGAQVPADGVSQGEIRFRGPAVSSGYFRMAEDSARSRSGDWLKTGDVGVIDKHHLITIVDRAKDIIITGGINVVSREVEEAIMAHPAVLEAAVIGVPHERWGEAIHGFVVCRPGTDVAPEDLIAFCNDRIAKFKRPQSLEFIDELPRTATGKVLKRVLRQRAVPVAS